MAWHSFSLTEKLDGEVEPKVFTNALEMNLRRTGSLKYEAFSPSSIKLVYRPKGHFIHAKAAVELVSNPWQKSLVVNVTGKSDTGIFVTLFMILTVLISNGILVPVYILLLIFMRKIPSANLEQALRAAVMQV
jgi:hypothetical protein